MDMPGYKQKQVAEERAKRAAADAEKQKIDTGIVEKLRAAEQKIKAAKKAAIEDNLIDGDFKKDVAASLGIGAVTGVAAGSVTFVAGILALQTVVHTIGAFVHSPNSIFARIEEPDRETREFLSHEKMKGLYFLDDLQRLAKEETWARILAVFLVGCLSVVYGVKTTKEIFEMYKQENPMLDTDYRKSVVDEKYNYAEMLKRSGLTLKDVQKIQEKCGNWVIAKMSEMDDGYILNLLEGGLNNANYETAVAIIAGYLKSHPEDYAEIIQIIDEATLPPEIQKKYGKTLSWGAALALSEKVKG